MDRAEAPYFLLIFKSMISMKLQKKLGEIIESEVESMGFELVKAGYIPRGRRGVLQVYIDHPERKISMDDCVSVSRALGLVLDGLEDLKDPYNLEVSSPGVDRPLAKPEHFERFTGKTAKIRYTGGDRERVSVTGKILRTDDKSVFISSQEGETRVGFESIIDARLQGIKPAVDKAGKGRPRGKRGKKRRKR